ncbi:LLM class flavin-dependent oxidoreductase [Amycolatopsis sp. VS8301801F10]|uniref:LLM class flavin-dependent oxidoreductase n=1 Tax=Amycolatopsis sp. VS8301801F10 TaxID=2652442 RepID=UPI0038FC9C3C
MDIGTGRPGIAVQLRELGLPVTPASRRLDQVREVVTALRELDGPDLHTPVVIAAGGPESLALAAEVADTVTFVMPQIETREQTMQRVRQFDNRRGLELALHVPVIGDSVAAFMAGPDTDVAAVRAADSVAFLRSDPAAAAEEIPRRREEMGFSYFRGSPTSWAGFWTPRSPPRTRSTLPASLPATSWGSARGSSRAPSTRSCARSSGRCRRRDGARCSCSPPARVSCSTPVVAPGTPVFVRVVGLGGSRGNTGERRDQARGGNDCRRLAA